MSDDLIREELFKLGAVSEYQEFGSDITRLIQIREDRLLELIHKCMKKSYDRGWRESDSHAKMQIPNTVIVSKTNLDLLKDYTA